jgi:hypothetical protein
MVRMRLALARIGKYLVPDYGISDGIHFNIPIIIARGSCDARLVE